MPAERGDSGQGKTFKIKGLRVAADLNNMDADTHHEYVLDGLIGKGKRVRQALFSGGGVSSFTTSAGAAKELRNIGRLTQNARAFGTEKAHATRELTSFTATERPTTAQFISLIGTSAGQLTRNVPSDTFDLVDALVGTYYFDLATRSIFDARPVADSKTALVLEANRVSLLEQVMLRLIDHVPIARGYYTDLETDETQAIVRATFGDKNRLSSENRLVGRLANTTFEIGAIGQLVAPFRGVEDRDSARIMGSHLRNLTDNLTQRFSEGGQMPTLVVQGADIGIPYDVIMGHPNTYHVPLPENEDIVADFYLVNPQRVHSLPTISRQYTGYSLNFADETVGLPLRLFKDGSVDFGWPLLTQPHRTINRLFYQANARDGLLYISCLLAALATDASAPPEIIEAETRNSGPIIKVLREAIARGERPMDVMSRVVIPRRVRIASRSWNEENTSDTGPSMPRREHQVRAYARKLQEGYARSDDNLALYLDDLEAGNIFPLSPEDDLAIRNGTKSYIHPVTRGDPRVGRIVAQRAMLGPGATRKILEGDIPPVAGEE